MKINKYIHIRIVMLTSFFCMSSLYAADEKKDKKASVLNSTRFGYNSTRSSALCTASKTMRCTFDENALECNCKRLYHRRRYNTPLVELNP